MKLFTKKRVAFFAVLAVTAAAAIGAYAYFTATGHGTGRSRPVRSGRSP